MQFSWWLINCRQFFPIFFLIYFSLWFFHTLLHPCIGRRLHEGPVFCDRLQLLLSNRKHGIQIQRILHPISWLFDPSKMLMFFLAMEWKCYYLLVLQLRKSRLHCTKKDMLSISRQKNKLQLMKEDGAAALFAATWGV